MTVIDFFILGIILISLLLGLSRGFVKEAGALLVWGIAIWTGLSFDHEVASFFSPVIKNPSIRIAAAFSIIVIIILALGSVVSYILSILVEKTGLTGLDRFAGMLLGIVRGMVVVCVLVMLIDLTPFSKQATWQKSDLIPSFHALFPWLKEQIRSAKTAL